MAKRINCPNCHLSIDSTEKTCPFCGEKVDLEVAEEMANEETQTKKPAKKKMHKYTLMYLIAVGLGLFAFIVMFLPGFASAIEEVASHSFYALAFGFSEGATKYASVRGATIIFVFELVGLLNFVAILWSVYKKTAEVTLFSYFTTFYYAVVVIISVVVMFGGFNDNANYELAPGVGIILVLLLALATATMTIVGVVFYKKHQKKKGTIN